MNDSRYQWCWFHREMQKSAGMMQRPCKPLLDMVEECDEIVSKIVSRPMSYASDRPQDFVVSVLSVRAFRLAVSAVELALCGHTDSTPNLDRTIFEIGIRLLDVALDPIPASLGYLLQGVNEEISAMKVELAHRRERRMFTGNLAANVERMRKHLQDLALLPDS